MKLSTLTSELFVALNQIRPQTGRTSLLSETISAPVAGGHRDSEPATRKGNMKMLVGSKLGNIVGRFFLIYFTKNGQIVYDWT